MLFELEDSDPSQNDPIHNYETEENEDLFTTWEQFFEPLYEKTNNLVFDQVPHKNQPLQSQKQARGLK